MAIEKDFVVKNGLAAGTNVTAANQVISTVATGTAPLAVTSTTRVSNLNVATAGTADTLTNARTIAISGDITGSATSFNGSANIIISTGITAGSIVSADFNSATSLIIYNSAGTAVKTVYSPGS